MSDSQNLLSGTKVGKEIRAEAAEQVAELHRRGIQPKLVVVLVGEDPASKVYVGSKARACAEVGLGSETLNMSEQTTQDELEEVVDRLNADDAVDGILVQLPLPAHLDSQPVLDRIDPLKDVDGFHPHNVGLLLQGRPRLVPCTPLGIMELLRRHHVQVKGKRAVVVGRSDIVGKPMAALLLHAHATVTICHSRTVDLAAVTRQAEVLVAAAGQRALIGPDHVADGAVVVDVGMHRVTDRAVAEQLFPAPSTRLDTFDRKGAILVGDVDFHQVQPRASWITPVPGGVGPLTIAMLMANTVRAATLRRGL